jgi:hypothetical protein
MPFLFSNKELYNQRIHHLQENPERAGFVKHTIDWKHSSANDYYTQKEKGLLELVRLDKTGSTDNFYIKEFN